MSALGKQSAELTTIRVVLTDHFGTLNNVASKVPYDTRAIGSSLRRTVFCPVYARQLLDYAIKPQSLTIKRNHATRVDASSSGNH